jgi:integrase/recombinase XerD
MDLDWDDFEKYLRTQRHYSSSTLDERTRKLRYIIKQGFNIDDPESCYDFFIEKLDGGSRATALNHYIRSLNAYYKYRDFEHKFTHYKENCKPIKIPTKNEIKAIISSFNRDWKGKTLKTMTYLLANSGMRIAEICNLCLDDVDWIRGSLTVVGKGDKTRVIPLKHHILFSNKHPSLQNYIKYHRKGTSKKYLFTWTEGKFSPKVFREYFKPVCRKAGVSWIHPHSLRHYYATMLLRNNVNVKIVQLILGHSDIKTTSRYLHMLEDDIFDAIQKTTFDDLLFSLTKLYGEIPSGLVEFHTDFKIDVCQGGSFNVQG